MEKTLSIIKPDAVRKGHIDEICKRIEDSGLNILEKKKMDLTQEEAEGFYSIHSDKPFFRDLVQFMTRGPIVAAALEKNNAVDDFRKLIGSTDPAEAEDGTIRKKYAKSKGENAVHGSDSDENAKLEISFHFNESEIFS